MGDAFEPPPSAVEAVRKKLSHFFLLVDMPDADFDKMEYKARYQSVADYFEISPDHYTGSTTTGTKRENVAKTLMSLRSAFKPSWVSRERLNLARDLLRGYVGCMFCLKEGARAGLMSTVRQPVSTHSSSDTHIRATKPADGVGVEPGLPMPPAGGSLSASQIIALCATGSIKPSTESAAGGGTAPPKAPPRQGTLGEFGVTAGGVSRDESIRALIAGRCTSLGLPPHTAAGIFDKDVPTASASCCGGDARSRGGRP